MKKQFISLFALLSFSIAFSQETSSALSGKIQDASHGNMKVKITYLPTNSNYETAANKNGQFSLNNLDVGGPYKIEVLDDKQNVIYTQNGIQLSLGKNDLPLIFLSENEPKGKSERNIDEVKLSAKKKAKDGLNISETQIQGLPNINRGIQDVTKLVPQSANNSFAGTNFRYNNVTIDGSINNDAIGFSPSLGGQTGTSGMPGSSTRTNSISLDAIQDVQVYIAPYDVKLGNFLGGSVNAVTRSGSNEVTGSIYTYGRNAAITGPNKVGDGSKMPKDFEDFIFGGRVGFPIVKDKVFFFTNMEYTKRTDPIFYNANNGGLINEATAQNIADFVKTKYGYDVGNYNNYNDQSQSSKFFNKLDWKINKNHSLSIRNNTVFSEATNLERDAANFRFGSMDFKQKNISSATTLEIKSRFGSKWANSLIIGYSAIHDFRNPQSSNIMFPQVEIGYNGGTIFLGNDREATVFNMKQNTFEITDNLTYKTGNHNFLLGTHNELYNINYGFVNAINGRISYKSLTDFYNANPSRIRGTYSLDGLTREDLYNNPYVQFNINLLSAYLQDEITLGRLKITPGIRVDYTDLANIPQLSPKVTNSPADPNYGTTYTYTPLSQINNSKIFNKPSFSPRIGFDWNVFGDKSLVVRGGSGIFTGRIPFAWLGYAFYNDGVGFGSYDYNAPTASQLATNGDPLVSGNFQKWQNSSKVQVDLIDNNFKMPQILRNSLAFDYTIDGYKFTLEGIYTKVLYDLKFQQVNKTDNPTYFSYDVNHEMPIYSSNINSNFSNAYLLSNTKDGYRYSITAQIAKQYRFGLNFFAAYTYGDAKDITNGIRNSMESNWQMNQSLTPNDPKLATSNFAINHRIVSNIGYAFNIGDNHKFSANIFFNAQSGNPFSWGFVNSTIAGSGQAAGLAYIFKDATEAAKYITNMKDSAGNIVVTAAKQVQDYEDFINSNPYLKSRRGKFTERNGDFTPWNIQADLRIMDEIKINAKQNIQISFSIMNLTNLLNKDWGKIYFVPNTFNSTSSIGLTKTGTVGGVNADKNDPTYNFKTPSTPYTVDQFASRFQAQIGIRYNF